MIFYFYSYLSKSFSRNVYNYSTDFFSCLYYYTIVSPRLILSRSREMYIFQKENGDTNYNMRFHFDQSFNFPNLITN